MNSGTETQRLSDREKHKVRQQTVTEGKDKKWTERTGLMTRPRCQHTIVNYYPFIGHHWESGKHTFMSQSTTSSTSLANTANSRCLSLKAIWENEKTLW